MRCTCGVSVAVGKQCSPRCCVASLERPPGNKLASRLPECVGDVLQQLAVAMHLGREERGIPALLALSLLPGWLLPMSSLGFLFLTWRLFTTLLEDPSAHSSAMWTGPAGPSWCLVWNR